MRSRSIFAVIGAAIAISSVALVPLTATAQDYRDRDRENNHHRRNQQNEWRDIAIGAGALGVLGLLSHDRTLFFAGTAGALYGAYRLDRDRDSDDRRARLRAEYFSRPYFYRDGVRYDRRTVWRNGREYYRFERAQ